KYGRAVSQPVRACFKEKQKIPPPSVDVCVETARTACLAAEIEADGGSMALVKSFRPRTSATDGQIKRRLGEIQTVLSAADPFAP
ncbi:MAG: hypothetical protein BJ554DRAFT_7792, partial [Olpidium bornovanus]